jgi:Na+-transporting methylmalonyl-CoA/oxaloacetate decarboxylase gamma subunit
MTCISLVVFRKGISLVVFRKGISSVVFGKGMSLVVFGKGISFVVLTKMCISMTCISLVAFRKGYRGEEKVSDLKASYTSSLRPHTPVA